MTRVTADFWVGAYLARLAGCGIPAHLVARGDRTAGAVLIKLAFMNGRASLFAREYDSAGRRAWVALGEQQAEGEIDAAIARQRKHDPDLWVVEVEDPKGRHMLDEMGVGE